MADKLVMRWWPAESRAEWVRPSDYPGMAGIALQVTSNHTHATMAAPESGRHELQEVSFAGGMASVVEFADPTHTLQVGEYIEHEIFLIQPDGVTIAPFSAAQLPLDVIIAGVGADPYQSWPEFAWRASRAVSGGYAGGVVEVGVYRNDEYTSLLSVWVAGVHFQTKEDGTSWSHPALPGNSDSVRLDSETGILWATLDGDFPIAPFWTGFKSAVEVNIKAAPIPPEPEPEPGVYELEFSMTAGEDMFGSTGFQADSMGSLVPETVDVGGVPGTVSSLYHLGSFMWVYIDDLFGIDSVQMVLDGGEPIDFVLQDGGDRGTVARAGVPISPFSDGQTYDVRLTLSGEPEAPEPAPEPVSVYIDCVMTAATQVEPSETYVGYGRDWDIQYEIDVPAFGSATPYQFTIADIPVKLYDLTYIAEWGGMSIGLAGVYGVESASIVINGTSMPVDVDSFGGGFYGWVDTPTSLFEDGETYNIRLYLEGVLRDTP